MFDFEGKISQSLIYHREKSSKSAQQKQLCFALREDKIQPVGLLLLLLLMVEKPRTKAIRSDQKSRGQKPKVEERPGTAEQVHRPREHLELDQRAQIPRQQADRRSEPRDR